MYPNNIPVFRCGGRQECILTTYQYLGVGPTGMYPNNIPVFRCGGRQECILTTYQYLGVEADRNVS